MDTRHIDEAAALPRATMKRPARLSRRGFLQATTLAAGGFALGLYIPQRAGAVATPASGTSQLNAFVKIATDGRITI